MQLFVSKDLLQLFSKKINQIHLAKNYMIENPGFIIRINSAYQLANDKPLYNCIKKLPKEYGPEIIENKEDLWEWLFFNPKTKYKLLQQIYFDDGDHLILFCGSIYNIEISNNIDKLKEKLLKISRSESTLNISYSLNSLSGYFCAIIGNRRTNKFLAITDKYGVGKLFYHINNEDIIFSTNLFLIKEYLGNNAEFSKLAQSSIIYCGHTFTDQSIIENVHQILPGHFINYKLSSRSIDQIDYMEYPRRSNLSLKESVNLVAESHRCFINKIKKYVENNFTLLLSRGKDCRVTLKHLLDSGLTPNILTYYKKNNALYPFVSFLLNNVDDSIIAEKICIMNNLAYQKIEIPNISFLENIVDILLLNNGSPTHWEIFKAAEMASANSNYLLSGFSGDFLAGKNLHHYRFRNVKNHTEYGRLTFYETSNINSYTNIFNKVKKYSGINLLSINELLHSWIEQYKTINSDDLNIIGWLGTVRTRSIGRIVPSFHQARLFTIPVYPYLDNDIINAYLTIPSKFIKGEAAHLMQISEDKRFNQFQTTRFPISAKKEKRFLKLINTFRKIDSSKSNIDKNKHINSIVSHNYNFALKNSLKEMNVLHEKFLETLLPENTILTRGYTGCVANFISSLRIKEVYFDRSIKARDDLYLINYKKDSFSLLKTYN